MGTPKPVPPIASLGSTEPINSWSYWLLLLEKAIHGAIVGALSVKGGTELAGNDSVGWHAIALSAGVGALYAILQGLGSDAVPGTLNQSFLPGTPKLRRAAATVHRKSKTSPPVTGFLPPSTNA